MSAGTLTLTNNSALVSGAGTSFTTDLAAGDFIVVTVGGVPYTLPVKSVESGTALTLVSNYTGPTQSGAAWSAVPRVALNMVTAALVTQSAEALRGLNYDKQNWQQVFSNSGNITVKLPDGTTFTGPSWNYLSAQLENKVGSGSQSFPWFGGLELASLSPYIDFHLNSSSVDYTARIIHTETNALEVTAATGNISFRVNGGIRVGGTNYAGVLNIYRGNGDANALWGLNCSDGNLNIARGNGAGWTIMMGDSVINGVRGIHGKKGSGGPYQGNTWQFYWNTSAQLEAWVDSINVGIVNLLSTSDKGLKDSIRYANNAAESLAEVMGWKPAYFKMKARGIIPETAQQLGFIANDLVKISPECVSGKGLPEDYDIESDPNNGDAYYLNHIPMIAKLAQALQAQQKIIDEQAASNKEQYEIIKAMGIRLKDLDGLDG